MFLSIIVPIYNAEQYLDECLESLLKQNIPSDEYEIICVNDGSTDNTSVILKNYEKRVHIINGFNSGVSRARNKGLEISGGIYLVC